jgi:mono/diheme cytochrome c family protein
MKKLSTLTLIILLMSSVLLFAACGQKKGDDNSNTSEVAKPSNGGGPGDAVNLTGDAAAGEKIFADTCVACHGIEGKSGVDNPGSTDGTVPSLNPIDETLKNGDTKIFATNIDLFIEHGSKPDGDNPALQMKAFGDDKTLTPQQIADVIAYVISLNK